MDEDLRAAKRDLRLRMRALLADASPAGRERKSRLMCGALMGTEAWRNAPLVAGFFPFGPEPDIRPLLEGALAEGRRLALPRIEGGTLSFRFVRSLEDCVPGAYGIREPAESLPRAGTEDPAAGDFAAAGTVILVPGLAFDRRGGRLGRGKGFYDRFLGRLFPESGPAERAAVVGICYGFQIVDRVPAGPEDRGIGFVLTEDGLLACGT